MSTVSGNRLRYVLRRVNVHRARPRLWLKRVIKDPGCDGPPSSNFKFLQGPKLRAKTALLQIISDALMQFVLRGHGLRLEQMNRPASEIFTRVNGSRQLAKLIEIIAAVNDARIDERGGFCWHTGTYPVLAGCVN